MHFLGILITDDNCTCPSCFIDILPAIVIMSLLCEIKYPIVFTIAILLDRSSSLHHVNDNTWESHHSTDIGLYFLIIN